MLSYRAVIVRTAIVVSLTFATTSFAVTSPTVSHPSPGGISARIAAFVQPVRETTRSLRAGLASPSFVARIQAQLLASRAGVPPLPTLPRPTSREQRIVATLPQPLRQPVAGLFAATSAATELLGMLPATQVAEQLQLLVRNTLRAPTTQRALVTSGHTVPMASGARPTVTQPAPQLSAVPQSPAVAHALAAHAVVAMLLAHALDAYLPAIRRYAAGHNLAGTPTADSCDLIDQTPYLCVASQASHTFTQNAVLLLALGGNNAFHNNSGGAPFSSGLPGGLDFPLSLNIDVGTGNDTFSLPVYRGPPPEFYAGMAVYGDPAMDVVYGSGAGLVGGMGMLVHQGGHDRFLAVASAARAGLLGYTSLVVAQGAGFQGSGFLFRSAGSASYLASGPSVTPPTAHRTFGRLGIVAQGACYYCSPSPETGAFAVGGLLLDAGKDASTYTIQQSPRTGPHFSAAWMLGQGASWGFPTLGGAGVLYDGGGADKFGLAGGLTNPAVGQTSYRAPGEQLGGLPSAPAISIYGQGFGSGLSGYLLEGTGNTSYDTESINSGPVYSWVMTQGTAIGALAYNGYTSHGVLDDQGGTDTYVARSTMRWAVHATTSCPRNRASSGCVSSHVIGADWCNDVLHPTTCEISDVLSAQGAASLGGVGLLEDHAGNHHFTVATESNLDASFTESPGHTRDHLDIVGYLPPSLIAQGASDGADGMGIGALVNDDNQGNDSYTAVASNATRSHVTYRDRSATTADVTTQNMGRLWQLAQGASSSAQGGAGILDDAGGTSDTFVARSEEPISSAPRGRTYELGGYWPAFQGSVGSGTTGGQGLFLDQSSHPVITSIPSRPVCAQSQGARGDGRWLECQSWTNDPNHQGVDTACGPLAVGDAPSAAPSPTSVSLRPGTSKGYRLGGGLSAVAQLQVPHGVVASGRVIHFDVQVPTGPCANAAVGSGWFNWVEIDAVTDAKGTASATLDVPTRGWSAGGTLQIYATYDGDTTGAGLQPSHAAQALSPS